MAYGDSCLDLVLSHFRSPEALGDAPFGPGVFPASKAKLWAGLVVIAYMRLQYLFRPIGWLTEAAMTAVLVGLAIYSATDIINEGSVGARVSAVALIATATFLSAAVIVWPNSSRIHYRLRFVVAALATGFFALVGIGMALVRPSPGESQDFFMLQVIGTMILCFCAAYGASAYLRLRRLRVHPQVES